MAHTQVISTTPLRWIDEAGMPRATNDAWHDAAQIVLSHAVPIIAKMQTQPVAVAEQTPAATSEDGLLPLAKEILSKYTGHAPVSWLQRKLRIDYARAYKLYHAIVHEPDTTPATPAPKVELREFTFRYWTKSDGQGHQDILAENREQALSVLWMLDGEYIDKVWAD